MRLGTCEGPLHAAVSGPDHRSPARVHPARPAAARGGTHRPGPLPEAVIVLGKENAAELGGPIEQAVVVPGRGSIVLAGQHVDPPPTEPYGDRDIHMMIHVELDTHGSRPRSRSLRRPGDSPAPARSSVTRSCRSAMSRSISCLWSK